MFVPKIIDISLEDLSELENWGIQFYGDIVYKYVSYETFYKIIENNSLYYSIPTEFNDPFDSSIDLLEFKLDSEEIQKTITDDFFNKLKIEENFQGLPLNDDLKSVFLSGFEKTYATTFEDLKNIIGITCFSKDYNNQLMWSHYADKHKGVCIGFRFEDYKNYIQKSVGYFIEIKPINQLKHQILSIYKWLFSKSKLWSYEKEIRRVKIDQNGLIPFNKDEIVEIYFGVRFPENEKPNAIKLLNGQYTSINKIRSMIINKKTFDIIETE